MQDSQQILKNVKKLLNEHKFIDTDQKLVLMYLKIYKNIRWDKNYISTQDFLNMDIRLVQQIIDAKYILKLLEDNDK